MAYLPIEHHGVIGDLHTVALVGTEPPSDPEGYWTQHFDIRVARNDDEARKLSGSGARWVAIGSAAKRLGRSGGAEAQPAVNDARFLSHLDFTRAVKTTWSWRMPCT